MKIEFVVSASPDFGKLSFPLDITINHQGHPIPVTIIIQNNMDYSPYTGPQKEGIRRPRERLKRIQPHYLMHSKMSFLFPIKIYKRYQNPVRVCIQLAGGNIESHEKLSKKRLSWKCQSGTEGLIYQKSPRFQARLAEIFPVCSIPGDKGVGIQRTIRI